MKIGKEGKTYLKRRWIYVSFFCAFIAICFLIFLFGLRKRSDESKLTVSIAVIQNDKVQDFNTNYYTLWLEEHTGYDIQFEYISDGYEREYLHTMLKSESNNIDAVFMPEGEEILSIDELISYGDDGLILDLSNYISEGSRLYQIMKQYESYRLYDRMGNNGAFYYMPNMDTARKSQNMQVLWINTGWLKQLDLQIPKTTDEFKDVLIAFRDNDPNGNGKKDELPLISCELSYSLQSYNYLLNAFAYNNPINARMYIDQQGNLRCTSTEGAFRQGLIYCRELYEERLLAPNCFTYTSKQLKELVNNPEDLIGAFTSKSIADVVYPNCPDILAKFIQMPPLIGPEGEQNAVWVNYEPKIGGYIPANSKHPQEALHVMNTMLSEGASLISEFGEEGVDWKYSDSGDLSTYGSKARVTTVNYLNDSVQNKNYAGAGPQVLDASIANGVTWNGNNSLVEYIDARAVRAYENYYRNSEDMNLSLSMLKDDENYIEICTFTDDMILQFITGEKNISDNTVWQKYLTQYKELEQKWNLEAED